MFENNILEKLDRIERLITGKHKDRYLNLKEVIELTGLSDSTIRRAVRSGTLKCKRLPGKMLFIRADIDKWLG